MNNYDYIIIGAGMAGLYMGYLLKKANKNILILEAEDKIGGRAIEGTFYNEPIKLGAGIGSMSNKILLSLLKKLKIKYEIFEGKVNKENVSPIGLNWNIDSGGSTNYL
jgi:monoamine oxidase